VEGKEKSEYQVESIQSSKVYFNEILECLYEHYTLDKAEVIATELEATGQSINDSPDRGTPEKRLMHRPQNYKFILYRRTSRADIKIIYYIDQSSKTVYVTDFFPTEKDDTQISKRS